MVTAPDQHKPGRNRSARIGAVLSVIALITYMIGNNDPANAERIWLWGVVGLLIVILLADWALRRNGLRR